MEDSGRKMEDQAEFLRLPSSVGMARGFRRAKPKKVGLNRPKLSKAMGRLSARYRSRRNLGGIKSSRNRIRSKQAANLAGMLGNTMKAPKPVGRYSSPVHIAEFAESGIKLMRSLNKPSDSAILQQGRGVNLSKNLKPKKPKKKLKAKRVKGSKGIRGTKGGPTPQPVITAFNPSPFGGTAKSLGLQV